MLWSVALALIGCGTMRPLVDVGAEPDEEPGSNDPTGSDDDDDVVDTSEDGGGGTDGLACVDEVSSGGAPLSLTGATDGEGDDLLPSCAPSAGGEDRAIAWTAPAAGDYVFDLAGSDYDTTLAVLDGCTGAELACNDDWLAGGASQVVVSLEAQQQVVVLVDGRRNQAGAYRLNVAPRETAERDCTDGRDPDTDGLADCDDTEDCGAELDCALPCVNGVMIGSFPIVANGTTVGAGNDTRPSCSSGQAEDLALQFTAPDTRTYTVSTAGSGFDTVLYVLDGCNGVELGCNDDVGVGRQSELQMPLNAGDTVVIVIDGYNNASGAVQIRIEN
jgi:hypothetical protein